MEDVLRGIEPDISLEAIRAAAAKMIADLNKPLGPPPKEYYFTAGRWERSWARRMNALTGNRVQVVPLKRPRRHGRRMSYA